MFSQLSVQPALRRLARREQCKMKHIVGDLRLHTKLRNFYKEEVRKKIG